MARQIAPGTPSSIDAKQVKVGTPDWGMLSKLGDAKIDAANNNFKLYAEALVTTESNKLYEQYKNDPVNLANALGKLPEMLSDLPPEIQDQMNRKMYLNGVSLVQKAQKNQIDLQDAQNKRYADTSIEASKNDLRATYANVLQNHMAKAEDKNLIMNDIFLQQVDNLQTLSGLRNSAGKDVYSDAQKKAIRNISDIEFEGFKTFFDSMILNDNDKLEQSQEYYTKFMLAPERFMAENYMDRKTYDAAVEYAKKQLKKANADIDKARFNQSVREATELQVANLPGKLESLKESGLIDKKVVDQIEKTNVKFDSIDPSKAESPIAMINLLQIMNDQRYNPAPKTNAEQQKILEQGTATLDAIAEYAQKYGLNPNSVQASRETVATIETNTAFAPILRNFGDIIDNFESKLDTVRKRSTTKGGLGTAIGNLTNIDGLTNEESIKIIKLNNLLAQSTDMLNQQIRNGDWDGVRQTQRNTQKSAAQIAYDWVDWASYEQDKDKVFTAPNGRAVKVKDFTIDGDVLFEIVK